MGRYGKIKVEYEVIRVDRYPHDILMRTEDFVDITNGRALVFPEGVMVVVGHDNIEGWGPDYYERYIHVVSTSNYYPVFFPNSAPQTPDDVIGYWSKDSSNKNYYDKKLYEVKRVSKEKGDSIIEFELREEGRWPFK